MINQTVDNRYHIEAIIGRGGMGSVYRATDLLQKESVALKFMHHYLDNRNNAFTRFQREFRTLAKLDHPNIVRTFGFGAHEGAPYLVLEYLEGHTLGDELATGPLSRDRLLDISRQICVALAYLHTQSIVHRDLKPGNLMLLNADTSSQIKLMDFGLVRTAELSMQLTQEGVALGTMAYIAPEQAQGIPVDFRADLYALGIILYEMAAGRPPFVHDNPAMLLMSQLTTNPPSPSQFNPNLDEPLEQLILQLLSKEPAQRPSSTDKVAARLAQLADDSGPISAVTPKKRVDVIPRVPLIGREKTLAQLNQWRGEIRNGTGKFMLLSGVAGAGKTRLLTEFKLQARLEDDRYLRGHCLEHGSLPYQPLIEILDPLAQDLPPSERNTLPSELTRLLPSISSSSVDTQPTTLNQPDAKLHLFNGCWELLRRSAQNKALMIAIEDVQWVDPSTMELINYLAHRVNQAPIMLAVSYRLEEIEPGSTINTALQELSRVGPTVTLQLLLREQVESYLQMALGKNNLPDWLVDSFYQSTDGNPLFIEETLKMLAAEGQVADWVKQDTSRRTSMSSITLQLPKTVLALAERRLQLLSAEDRSILTAAAVLGQEFPFTLLQAVTQLDEDPLLDAIDRLLAARLIEELPLLQNDDDTYSFVQEALRQALLSTVSQRRLRRMHQRSGEAIQSIYDTGQARYWPLLAYHFAAAGDNDRALKYFTLAGDAAANQYATAEAVNYYSNAINIIKTEQAEATDDQLLHLFIQRGRNLELNNLFDEALQNYKTMLGMAKKLGDPWLELEALLAMAVLHTTPTPLHNLEQGQALCQQSLDLALQIDNQPAEAKALWNIMNIHKFKDEYQQAITVGNQALDIARQLNLRQQMAYILNDISWIYINAGQMDTALQSSAEARELWKELNNLPMLADNLTGSATYNLITGQLTASMNEANQSLEVSRNINNIWNISQSGWIKGLIHLIWGEFEQAIGTLESIITLESTSSFANPLVNARADLGLIYGSLGHIEQGIAFCLEAQENVSSEMFQNWQAYPSAILAQLYVLKGDFEAANQSIDACRPKLNESGITPAVVWLATAEAELAMKLENYSQALNIANQLIAQLRQMNLNVFLDLGLFLKGQALFAQNRTIEAREALQEALQLGQAQTARYILWQIQITLYELERQNGNPANAKHLHQQAQQTIEYIIDHAPLHLQTSFLARPKIRQVMEKKTNNA